MQSNLSDEPRLVFGPGDSYVAWLYKRDRNWSRWSDDYNDTRMREYMNKGAIQFVALGYCGAYYIKYQDGRSIWNMKEQYPELDELLEATHTSDVEVREFSSAQL